MTDLRSIPAAPPSSPTASLNILLVLEPGVDGAFRHVESLAHYLLKQKQRVHLAFSDRRGSTALTELVARLRAEGGQCVNLETGNAPEVRDVIAFQRLWNLARRVRPEVIHCHSSKAGILGRALSFLGVRARYFYTPHAYYGLAHQRDRRLALFNFLETFFGRIGTTINISDDERRFACHTLKLPPDRCILINNPVDPEKFVPPHPEARRAIRAQWGLPLEARVVGSMGRLSFQKDPETLYRSFAEALQRGANLHLLHVGTGDLNDAMQTLADDLRIRDRILRIPYLERPQDFFAAADGLIMTSRYEGFWPMVVLEALACGLPVICGTGPGTSDIGKSGLSHCWTSPVGDTPRFAEAILALDRYLDHPQPSNHRQIVMERFSENAAFGLLLRLCNGIDPLVTHGSN